MKKKYAALIFCAIGLLLGSVTSEAKKKPSVTAESAIVMDVQSGAILYEKNIDKREYPASITKVMTALVAIENSSLSETVTYSRNAVTNLESGASNIEIQPGEKLSMEDSLYAILLMSANEEWHINCLPLTIYMPFFLCQRMKLVMVWRSMSQEALIILLR